MNLSPFTLLNSIFRDLNPAWSQTASSSPAAAAVFTPTRLSQPATAAAGGMEVLQGTSHEQASAFQWYTPASDRGIIIVGGKAGSTQNTEAERGIIIVGGNVVNNEGLAATIRDHLDNSINDLQGQDKLGNFEIQDLMSQYNQDETLESSVQKKQDDTASAVIDKI